MTARLNCISWPQYTFIMLPYAAVSASFSLASRAEDSGLGLTSSLPFAMSSFINQKCACVNCGDKSPAAGVRVWICERSRHVSLQRPPDRNVYSCSGWNVSKTVIHIANIQAIGLQCYDYVWSQVTLHPKAIFNINSVCLIRLVLQTQKNAVVDWNLAYMFTFTEVRSFACDVVHLYGGIATLTTAL